MRTNPRGPWLQPSAECAWSSLARNARVHNSLHGSAWKQFCCVTLISPSLACDVEISIVVVLRIPNTLDITATPFETTAQDIHLLWRRTTSLSMISLSVYRAISTIRLLLPNNLRSHHAPRLVPTLSRRGSRIPVPAKSTSLTIISPPMRLWREQSLSGGRTGRGRMGSKRRWELHSFDLRYRQRSIHSAQHSATSRA